MPMTMSRRRFLLRSGVLAAALGASQAGLRLPAAHAQSADDLLDPLLAGIRPVLQQLAADTIAGICVFLIPGDDDHSQHQGLTDDRPGAIDADNVTYMLESLDNFLPIPDTAARSLAQAFATGVSDVPIPEEFTGGLLDGSDALDDVLLQFLENDGSVPVSLVIAMYFNFAATIVNPAALGGPFPSPFANLSYEEKGAAFEVIETEHADLVAAIDGGLDEPSRASVSGLLRFVPGAVLEFVGFGTMSEYHQFDPEDPERLKGRPVGWELTRFQEGMLSSGNGWDEFLGYHEGVRDVEGSWDRGEGVLGRA